jgi:hypothetical protein
VAQDWFGDGVDGQGIGIRGAGYPRFTRGEGRKMLRTYAQGHRINPSKMGNEWNSDGPRVSICIESVNLPLILRAEVPARV